MKKTFILTFVALGFAILVSNTAGAASYTLKPISIEESKLFKNKPTVVFRIGKDTAQDFANLKSKLYGYYGVVGDSSARNSEVVDTSVVSGNVVVNRLKYLPAYNGESPELRYYSLTNKIQVREEEEFMKITSPQIFRSSINIRVWMEDKNKKKCTDFTDTNSPTMGESCWELHSIISGRLNFETHLVSVAILEEKIAELKTSLNSTDKTDEEKAAISKLIEKAEGVLNNQDAIQTEIDTAVAGIENGLKEISDNKAKAEEERGKAEEDRKKAEEEKKKQEESANQTEDNKTQQTPQEVAPQSAEISTKDASTSDLKSPNTGFNQSNSSLALISIFATILLGATIYRLKK